MNGLRDIDRKLRALLPSAKTRKILSFISRDGETNSYLEQANTLAILRLGYNDHGPVHAKLVAEAGLTILQILTDAGFRPNLIAERVGTAEDAKVVILLGAWLHDIGCALSRENHEILGVVLARPIIRRALRQIYRGEKLTKMSSFVLECILCHMGTHEATSLEAKIVEVADGLDVTSGRARIPFHIGKADIHKFSALAIERVDVLSGKKKPLRVEVFMTNPAGIFQAEQIMLKKIRDADFEDVVELVAKIRGEKRVRYL